jgi:hypothetical protein
LFVQWRGSSGSHLFRDTRSLLMFSAAPQCPVRRQREGVAAFAAIRADSKISGRCGSLFEVTRRKQKWARPWEHSEEIIRRQIDEVRALLAAVLTARHLRTIAAERPAHSLINRLSHRSFERGPSISFCVLSSRSMLCRCRPDAYARANYASPTYSYPV